MLDHEIKNSNKYSLRFAFNPIQNVSFDGNKYAGSSLDTKFELTLPYLSEANFFKFDLTHKTYLKNPKKLKLVSKDLYKNSNIELNNSLMFIVPYLRRNNRINDKLYLGSMRGFTNLGKD